jgi:hypothetical protein
MVILHLIKFRFISIEHGAKEYGGNFHSINAQIYCLNDNGKSKLFSAEPGMASALLYIYATITEILGKPIIAITNRRAYHHRAA